MSDSFLNQYGARTDPGGTVTDFGSWRDEVRSASAGVTVFDQSDRDRVALTGTEIAPFLNRLLTYAMTDVAVGDGCRPFMLDARGRIILSFTYLRVAEDRVLLEAPSGHGEAIRARIDMFHFGEDFAMEDINATSGAVSVCGPKAEATLKTLGLPTPQSPWSHAPGQLSEHAVRVVSSGRLKRSCFDIWAAPLALPTIWSALVDSGATPGGRRAFEYLRIEDGVPVYPREFGEHCTPLDASGTDGLTDGKGCYPGQEVIERTLALGRPSRVLVGLQSDGPLQPGDSVTLDGVNAGVITSGCEKLDGGSLGLALLKNRAVDSEALMVGDAPVHRRPMEH